MLALTDFSVSPPFFIRADRSLRDARQDMAAFGVCALLVVRERQVVGLVTHADLADAHAGAAASGIIACELPAAPRSVGEVMQRLSPADLLQFRTLMQATLADVAAVFSVLRVSHIVIVEPDEGADGVRLRGMLSRECLERRLGRRVPEAPRHE